MDWLIAWPGQGETLPESPPLQQRWPASDWSCSRKLSPSSPELRCCGIPEAKALTQQWKESQLAARELGLQLHSMEVSSADKFEEAFRAAAKAQSAAISVRSGSVNTANPKLIADLAVKYRLPAIFDREDFIANRRLDVLRTRPGGRLQAGRHVCRQDP